MRSSTGFLRRCRLAALVLVAVQWTATAEAAPKTHTVYSGQRLGSIAKRYNVTIDELCRANGISRKDKIFPGQKLVIPEPGKPVAPPAANQKSSGKSSSNKGAPVKRPSGSGHPRLHVVAKGQTLGAIARRYGVAVDAVCHASGINRRSVLKVGQRLVVPAVTDPRGEYARSLRVSDRLDHPSGPPSWEKYSRAPWRRGYVTIQGYSTSWKGYVLGPGEKVLPKARADISRVLGVREGGARIDERLIRLMAQVSDQFGGRPLRIVSGYRKTSFVHDSKHKVGRALDFSIPGVPNEALRDYCRTLGSVGVGYYPNSTFVHLDVRPAPAYWVDYAGPGEPPRSTPYVRRGPRRAARLAREDTAAKGDTGPLHESADASGAPSEPPEDSVDETDTGSVDETEDSADETDTGSANDTDTGSASTATTEKEASSRD